jgi:YHS domain-containing protein
MWTKTLTIALSLTLGACSEPADKGADKKAETKTDAKVADKTAAKKADTKADAKADAKAGPAHLNLDEQGRALRGFDAVAYLLESKPVEGKAEFTHQWNDAKWLFASAENMKKFAAEPEKFAPANGGYCTFGVVLSKKFDGDPNVWHVMNDSLHVFLNAEVKDKFLQDEQGNLEKVKTNWPAIKDKTPDELGK